jgi:hypothetical protein
MVYSDSTVIRSTFIFKSGDKQLFEVIGSDNDTLFLPVDLKANDTLVQEYTIHNYLAYDDGTAEFSAGVNLIQGELALAFYAPNPDTLTDIDIYFPAISPSTVGQAIEIKVWSNLSDQGVLRQRPAVIEATGRNTFQRFALGTPIIVQDTFYIGFEQFTNNYIGVGFDRNNTAGSSFIYSFTDEVWKQNDRVSGSLMIRPVFRSASDFILGNEREPIKEVVIYPNPSIGHFSLDGAYEEIYVFDLYGRVVYHSTTKPVHDASSLEPGIYFVRVQAGDQITTKKLLLNP